MSEEDITPLTKEWIRDNWDYENENASKAVLLAKLVHEIHIIIPGIAAAAVVCPVFWHLGADDLKIAGAFFACLGGGYALFFQTWWCSTVTGEGDS